VAKVRFSVGCPGAKTVYLAGCFNDWDPTARRMKRVSKGKDEFVAVLDLEPGRHEYKYVVDGEWVCCPNAPRAWNDQGAENSVIEVEA
jgi:1,4-alpha-glucan branching enzyme